MAKESNTPKAINIVRPGHSITTAPKFQVFSPLRNNAKPPSDLHKPKVMTTAQISLNDRPGLALFASHSPKHVLDSNSQPSHRQLVASSNRIPPVIISASSLNTKTISTHNNGFYANRTSSTVKSQISVHSSEPKASSVVSDRSDASIGLASVHSDKSRSSSSSHPYVTDRNTIRRPPGIVISNEMKDPPRRIINVPTSESNLDEDRPRYYDITTNVEDDTSSDVESESNNEKSDYNSGIESEEEEEVSFTSKKMEEDEDDGAESPINEARINRKIADLEISNQSLLAVNTMLESTVRKQAKQIAELQKSKPSTDIVDTHRAANQDNVEVNELIALQNEEDEHFQRINTMIDRLIEEAQAAIDYKITNGGRVLSLYDDGEEEAALPNSNSSLSFSGTDEDTTTESPSSPVNLPLRQRTGPESPLQQRSSQPRRTQTLSARRSASPNSPPLPLPTSRDIRPSKSTAILPNSNSRLPNTRKVVTTANTTINTINNRRSRPKSHQPGRGPLK
ncbi:hypothetical protein INT44_008895 [Umbelopsis vinacea]|uniref:Uncharacterized protein n=1 Tax=Umbelopsis vinacea TaxID=44442 RepID=A0A8H7Q019_9FUNG|nr:hypothetical protein INT44_008895 [Umbelopsis vinacea]